MIRLFRVLGKLTGQALKSHAIDRAITSAATHVASEMRLTDIKLKRAILRRKRNRHLTILGRTVYRLIINDINPASDKHIITISRVLVEIESEINAVEHKLKQRMEQERQKNNTPGNTGNSNKNKKNTGNPFRQKYSF